MGLTLNWFKDYEILQAGDDDYILRLLEQDEYDHSYKTVSELSDLMAKYTGSCFCIPRLPAEYEIREDTRLDLVPPERMTEVCETVLRNIDGNDTIVYTLEKLKSLSEKGYYLAYDNE